MVVWLAVVVDGGVANVVVPLDGWVFGNLYVGVRLTVRLWIFSCVAD